MGIGSLSTEDYCTRLLTKLSLRAPKGKMEENHELWMENHNHLNDNKNGSKNEWNLR